MKKPTESNLVKACLQLLSLHGVMAWRNNSTGVWDASRKCFRTFSGLKGTSDILGCLHDPAGKGGAFAGRLLAIECKMPKGRLSVEQDAFLTAVRERGGLAFVIRDVAQLHTILEQMKL